MNKIVKRIKVLIQNGLFHILCSKAFNAVAMFLANVVVVNILTKKEYGTYTYAWNIYSIVILFNGMGMESGVLQIASEKNNDRYKDAVIEYGLKKGMKVDFILLAIMVFIGVFMPLRIPNSKELILFMTLLPFAQFANSITMVRFRVKKQNKEYAYISMCYVIVYFTIAYLLTQCIKEYGIITAIYLACLISVALGYCIDKHNNQNEKRDILDNLDIEFSALNRIAVVSAINNGISSLLYLLDIFVLGIIDPRESILAGYKVATIIPTGILFIPTSVVIFIYPYFAEHKNDLEWVRKNYIRVLMALGSVNALLSAILFLFAPQIIGFLFGNNYMDIVSIFRVLSINYFISGTFKTLTGNLLVTQRKLKFNFFAVLTSGLLNIIVDYFFIKRFGAIGAAYATVLVVIVLSIMVTIYWIYTIKLFSGEDNEIYYRRY